MKNVRTHTDKNISTREKRYSERNYIRFRMEHENKYYNYETYKLSKIFVMISKNIITARKKFILQVFNPTYLLYFIE